MQGLDKSVHAAMKQVSEYFGELHEAGDPARVLRVIRNFMPVFDKTLEEVKVCSTLLSAVALLYGCELLSRKQAHMCRSADCQQV